MEVTLDTQTPVSIISVYSFLILVHPFGTNKDNLFNSESFLGLAIILLFLVILINESAT